MIIWRETNSLKKTFRWLYLKFSNVFFNWLNVLFQWRTSLMTFLTLVALLASIGLVFGDMENAWDCCVMGNISANTWRLHAPALLLLVLLQKWNMLPDCPPVSITPSRWDNLSIFKGQSNIKMLKVWQTTDQLNNPLSIEPSRFSKQWLDLWELANLEFGNCQNYISMYHCLPTAGGRL